MLFLHLVISHRCALSTSSASLSAHNKYSSNSRRLISSTLGSVPQGHELNDIWEAAEEQGVRILKYAIPSAATAYAIKSAVSR